MFVGKLSSGTGPFERSTEGKPDAPNRAINAERDEAVQPAPSFRPIINPYVKGPPEPDTAQAANIQPASNAPARRPMVNPYAKSGNASAAAQLPDAFKMMMDPKYRALHQRPPRKTEPPIPYEGLKAEKARVPREQKSSSIASDPNLPMKRHLKDAYFKIDDYNYVTAEKHKELLKSQKSSIGVPQAITAHDVVLLSDRTKTKLVSPKTLAGMDKEFAKKKFSVLNIDQKAETMNPAGKMRHEILILSPKNDQIKAVGQVTPTQQYKPHQIFVAVDQDSERQFVDLRTLIAERISPSLSEKAQDQLKRIADKDTSPKLARFLAEQQQLGVAAKRPNTMR